MSENDYIQSVIALFPDVVEPLIKSLNNEADFRAFLLELGWPLEEGVDLETITNSFADVVTNTNNLKQDIVNGEGLATLTVDITRLVAALASLSTTNYLLLPAPLDQQNFWETFPDDVLNYLIYSYFKNHQRFLFGVLSFIGVLSEELEPEAQNAGHVSYKKKIVDLSRMPSVLSKPQDFFPSVYGWGQEEFYHKKLLSSVAALIAGLGSAAQLYPADDRLLDLYYSSSNPERGEALQIVISPFQLKEDRDSVTAYVKPVLIVLPVPAKDKPDDKAVGVLFFPCVTGGSAASIRLSEGVNLQIQGQFSSDLIKIILRPEGAELVPPNDITLDTSVRIEIKPVDPLIVAGNSDSTRLEVHQAHLSLELIGSLNNFNLNIEGAVDEGKFILDFSQSDGFLQKIIGSTPQTIVFSPGLTWSNHNGFKFLGQTSLEVCLPVNLDLAGIVSVVKIYFDLKANPDNNSMRLIIAFTGGLSLGPLVASIERIGLFADIKTASKESPGNFGLIDLGFGFKPPNGVGLSLDTSVVKGGGYLYIDTDKGEYMGALELQFQDMFSLKAIGIINTVLPDGSKGYSLLIIITAEFSPIQIGMGFSLNGVGGLLGVHRTTKIDVLKEGVKTNALKSILFPEDVIANITRIVSDIKQVFPPQEGHYVLGPMAKIAWADSIITLELGLLLEIPDPKIAILGVLKAILPDEESGILQMQINFLGVIDFENKYISFDASLYDSRLLVYTLTGDMAFRLFWGDKPLFILSCGGFHPAFKDAPADLQKMTRLTISLLSSDEARISVQTYFAVTSNTVQFGAKAELLAQEGDFSVYGFAGYDVLFQFQPFHFIAALYAGFALRCGSDVIATVTLNGQLTGPSPWCFDGEASISLLLFDVSVKVHHPWGDTVEEIPPSTVDLLALLVGEVYDNRNWKADLPDNSNLHVTVKKIEATKDVPAQIETVRFENAVLNKLGDDDRTFLSGKYTKNDAAKAYILNNGIPDSDKAKIVDLLTTVQFYDLIIHPFGILTLSERLVPLGVAIEKFGNQLPLDAKQFSLTEISSSGTSLTTADAKDNFARCNFFHMSDTEKLSHASFDLLTSGFKVIASAGLQIANADSGSAVIKDVDYELAYWRKDNPSRGPKGIYKLRKSAFRVAAKCSAAAQSPLSSSRKGTSKNGPDAVAVVDEEYAIANVSDLTLHAAGMMADSYTEAAQMYNELITEKPELIGHVQILSEYELSRD